MKKYEFPENGKFIYKHGNSYQVIKQYRINGKMKQKHFGSFKDYNEAIKHRDKCVKGNWSDDLRYVNPMRYITKNGKHWQIQHKGEYYGTFRNLTDAMAERDLLIENGWDLFKTIENDDSYDGTSIFLRRMY